jgi:hypothetical protein
VPGHHPRALEPLPQHLLYPDLHPVPAHRPQLRIPRKPRGSTGVWLVVTSWLPALPAMASFPLLMLCLLAGLLPTHLLRPTPTHACLVPARCNCLQLYTVDRMAYNRKVRRIAQKSVEM